MNITPETLARLAVHLLNGTNYRDAVRRAYALLEAAETEIQRQGELQSMTPSDAPAHLDYVKGICFITGQKRRDRAEEYFTDFLNNSLRESKQIEIELTTGTWPASKDVPQTTKPELRATIDRYEKKGFAGSELVALRGMYQKRKRKSLEGVTKGQD
jgi:hypothetical protein